MNLLKLRKFQRSAFLILFFALLAAFLLFNKSFTTSGDVLPMAVWQDQDGQATFEQVIATERDSSSDSLFSRKVEKGFSGGYTSDAIWFKLTLQASSEPSRIYLEVQPTYLDYVSLYWPDDQGNFQEQHLGDRVAFSQRPIHSRGFVFPVDLGALEKTAYLRLKTSSSSLMLVKVWQRDAFHQKNQRDYFLFALLLGIGISLIFFNSLQMVGQKSFMYYAFIFFLVVQVIAIFVINGFASEFLFPNHPEIDSAFVGVVTMLLLMTISLGHYFFLRLSWQETPILFSLTWGGVLLSVVGIAGAISGFYVKTTPLIGLYTIMLYAVWILFGLRRIQQKDPYAHWVVFASVAGIFSSVAMILVLLGWFSVESVGLYAYQVGAIAGIFAFQMIVSGNIKDALLKNKQLTIERVTHRKLLQQEQATQQKQSQFIAMLTHEIKTPLSIIQMALSQQGYHLASNAKIAAQDIIQILDRSAISEQLETTIVEVSFESIAVAPWLIEFLPQVQDEHERLSVQIIVDAQLRVKADPVYLRIVLSNLIENALKYSRKASPVQLKLFKLASDNGQAEIALQVSNQVDQQALPDAERLFDKYYRAPTSHRVSGSGVGLYLVKALSEAMHARVSYAHSDTQVCFTVYFPIETPEEGL